MKRGAIIFIFLFTCFAAAQDTSQIVGRWRTGEAVKGAGVFFYDFDADGMARFSRGKFVHRRYHLEGARLTFNPIDGNVYQVMFNGADHLHLVLDDGRREDYSRVGVRQNRQSESIQDKLLGEWSDTRESGGSKVAVHLIFDADSDNILITYSSTQNGTFTLQDGKLVATFGGRVGLDGMVKIEDGELAISNSGERVVRLMRY